jgi:hypothetical protein
MCNPVTAIAAGGQILSGYGAYKAGKRNANAVVRAAAEQAGQELSAAGEQANQVRKEGARAQSSARAAYAASGVVVDSGTADDVQDEFTQGYENDAAMVILGGDRRANSAMQTANNQAQSYRRQGRQALTSALLSTGISAASGWRGMSRKTTTQAPEAYSDSYLRWLQRPGAGAD